MQVSELQYKSKSLDLPELLKGTVVMEPVTHNGMDVSAVAGNKVLLNGSCIGNVGNKTVLTPYPVMWDNTIEGLREVLDLTDAKASIYSYGNGASMSADIMLKAYSYEKIIGEPTSLRCRIKNSLTSRWAYYIEICLLRLSCLNGQSSIANKTFVWFKHTKGAEPQRIAHTVKNWPYMLENEATLHNYMKTVPISRQEAIDFLSKTLCVTKTNTKIKTNEKFLSRVMHTHDMYSNGLGSNGYAMFNTLTHYGSHCDSKGIRKSTDPNAKVLRQEERSQQILRSVEFKKLIQFDNWNSTIN